MMVLTKEQIDDMRVSLGKGAQPFTKEAIESLCAMAQGALRAEVDASGWISVKDRLPEVNADYLVASKPILEDRAYVYTSTYEKPGHGSINGWDISGVTHWMHLPALPGPESPR